MANNPPNNPNPNPNVNQQQESSLKRIQTLLDQINRSYNSLGERSPFGREAQKVVKGFEDAEKDLLISKGAIPFNFGRNILRSETAAVYLLSILDYLVKL